MNGTLELVLGIAALVLGIVGVMEAKGRNWAAWGVICLASIIVLSRL